MDQTYGNLLKQYLTQPGSYQSSPGYQFSLDQATQAAQRGAAAMGMRGSGNLLADLTKLGAGYASQDYGNTIQNLIGANNSAQQYDLGLGQNANAAEANRLTGIRDANNLTLGLGQNQNVATRNANDLALGQAQNQNVANRNTNDFNLGMFNGTNSYNLGQQQNANTSQNNWYNYQLGLAQNANTAARNQNDFNLGMANNGVNWYNAQTGRGEAQSNAWLGDQGNQRAWYQIFPRQRIAGQP